VTSVRLGPVVRQYTYDALNRVTGMADTQGGVTTTQGFAYDEAGHLVAHSRGSGAGYATTGYTYDSNGNRTYASTTTANGNTYPGSSITYVPGTNGMATDSTGRGYTYGADGNPTSDSLSDYSYNAYGRLTSVVGGVFGVPHWQLRSFNGQGMRVSSFMQYWVDTSGAGGGGQYRAAPGSATGSPATTSGATVDTAASRAVAGAAKVPTPGGTSANSAIGRPAGAMTGPNAAKQATAAAQAAITAALGARAAPAHASAARRMSNSYRAALASARAGMAANAVPEASAPAAAATSSTAGRSRLTPQNSSLVPTSSGYWEVAQNMHYLHADDGSLLGEYGTNGQYGAPYTQETIWFQGMPVGAKINGVLYNISPDHLGTPRSIARASDNGEVWRWGGDPFGADEPTGPGGYGLPLITYNLRFAGQQYEMMTGHHYNWMRDYQPWTGRYLQSDPIGLAGGLSRYGYVGGNPISRTDPKGLYWFQQGWQARDPIVGRQNTFVAPGGPISSFVERYVPAGRTLAEIHDPMVNTFTGLGVPDSLANIPTMPSAYLSAIGLEILRSLGIAEQPAPANMCPR